MQNYDCFEQIQKGQVLHPTAVLLPKREFNSELLERSYNFILANILARFCQDLNKFYAQLG